MGLGELILILILPETESLYDTLVSISYERLNSVGASFAPLSPFVATYFALCFHRRMGDQFNTNMPDTACSLTMAVNQSVTVFSIHDTKSYTRVSGKNTSRR